MSEGKPYPQVRMTQAGPPIPLEKSQYRIPRLAQGGYTNQQPKLGFDVAGRNSDVIQFYYPKEEPMSASVTVSDLWEVFPGLATRSKHTPENEADFAQQVRDAAEFSRKETAFETLKSLSMEADGTPVSFVRGSK